jgi:hypothetical protein
LNFFGESPIFFGSILNLIWIIENNAIKMKIKISEKTWTTWSPSLIEVADQVDRNALSTMDMSRRAITLVFKRDGRD